MKSIWFYEYPVGTIGIEEESGAISQVFFAGDKSLADIKAEETPLIQKAAEQLVEYFDGKRKVFNLPLALQGTDFQKSVWQALLGISYGETCSYKDIAMVVGNPKASRAVGMANNRNPIAIIVPCHRVIGQNGSLIGYGGGLSTKQYLLDLERRYG